MNKTIIVGVIVLLLIGVGAYFKFGDNDNLSNETNLDGNVALVNGVAISQSTFDSQLALSIASFSAQNIDASNPENLLQIKTQVLNTLINDELLAQEVVASGISVDEEEVEREIQVILNQAGSQETFDKQLADANITEAQLRGDISKQLAVRKYLLQNIDINSITVSDEEVQKFYDDNKVAQPELPPFEEVKDQARGQLLQNKQQELVNQFVKSIRDKADIEMTPLN